MTEKFRVRKVHQRHIHVGLASPRIFRFWFPGLERLWLVNAALVLEAFGFGGMA